MLFFLLFPYAGLAMQMIQMVRTHRVQDLAPLLVTAGILERKEERPAAPFRLDQPRLSAIWSQFCLVFIPSQAEGSPLVKCTCWYHQHYGHCVHCYSVATYKGFMREEAPCQTAEEAAMALGDSGDEARIPETRSKRQKRKCG